MGTSSQNFSQQIHSIIYQMNYLESEALKTKAVILIIAINFDFCEKFKTGRI